jgi:hypothetical protein
VLAIVWECYGTTTTLENLKVKQFSFHHDGGHGWLQVPEQSLKDLGIEHYVSGHSYLKDKQVYLEEDMDASLFIAAWKAEKGKEPDWFDFFEDGESKIRNFDRYPAKADRSFKQVMHKIGELNKGL